MYIRMYKNICICMYTYVYINHLTSRRTREARAAVTVAASAATLSPSHRATRTPANVRESVGVRTT